MGCKNIVKKKSHKCDLCTSAHFPMCTGKTVVLDNPLQCYCQHQHWWSMRNITRMKYGVSQGDTTDSFNKNGGTKWFLEFWYSERKHVH